MNATTAMAATIAVAWALLVALSPRGFFLLAVPVCAAWMALSARAAGPGLRARLRPRPGDLAVALAVAGALYAGTTLFTASACGGPTRTYDACGAVLAMYRRFDARAVFPAAVLALLAAPAEELFWRGVVQERLARRLGRAGGVAAATATAAAAAFASGEPLLALATLPTSAAWGALAAWRGSLVAPILSHAAWTLLVALLRPL